YKPRRGSSRSMSTPSRPTGTMKIKGSKCVLKSVSYRMGPPGILPKFPIGSRFWHRCEWEDIPCSSYAKFYRRSHDAVIRVYDNAGNVIEAHEHKGDFNEWQRDQNVCDYRVSRLS